MAEISVLCSDWSADLNTDLGRNISQADSVLATSATFSVEWSKEYQLSLHRGALDSCPPGGYL